jgi:hypothetical protein
LERGIGCGSGILGSTKHRTVSGKGIHETISKDRAIPHFQKYIIISIGYGFVTFWPRQPQARLFLPGGKICRSKPANPSRDCFARKRPILKCSFPAAFEG